MAKWSKLQGSIPRFRDTDNRDKIDRCKADLDSRKDPEIAQIYNAINGEKKALEERVKEINVLVTAITEILVDRWNSEGVSSKDFEGLGKLSLSVEPYCQFLDVQKLKPFLEKNGMSHLVQEMIQWQSGNSFIKSLLEEGKEVPSESIVRIFLKDKIRLYKEK